MNINFYFGCFVFAFFVCIITYLLDKEKILKYAALVLIVVALMGSAVYIYDSNEETFQYYLIPWSLALYFMNFYLNSFNGKLNEKVDKIKKIYNISEEDMKKIDNTDMEEIEFSLKKKGEESDD